jgi:hypothetical protein
MKNLFVIASLLLVFTSFAQEAPSFKKPTAKSVKESSARPVTHAEAKKTFEKVWRTLQTGLKLKGNCAFSLPQDGNAITQNEVLSGIYTLYGASKASFTRAPKPIKFNLARLRKDVSPTHIVLIEKGIVDPYGLLTTATVKTLTPKQFGDVVAIAMIRITDLIHTPSQKFSPDLMRPDK